MSSAPWLRRFARENLLEFESLQSRHDALAQEMERRGYRHSSPLTGLLECRQVTPEERAMRVNVAASLADLIGRCTECRRLFTIQSCPLILGATKQNH
jgi:hypothetical protein